jgi:hypothetical protein
MRKDLGLLLPLTRGFHKGARFSLELLLSGSVNREFELARVVAVKRALGDKERRVLESLGQEEVQFLWTSGTKITQHQREKKRRRTL